MLLPACNIDFFFFCSVSGFSKVLPYRAVKFVPERSYRESGGHASLYQGMAWSKEIQESQREKRK